MINGTVEHQSLEVSRFITAGGEGEGVGEIMKRSVAIANLKLTLIMSNLKQVFRILFWIPKEFYAEFICTHILS